MKTDDFQFLTIEPAKTGGGVSVKGYKRCTSGVMEGQLLAHFLDSFDNVVDAHEAYPDARIGNEYTTPQPTFDHLPDDSDY